MHDNDIIHMYATCWTHRPNKAWWVAKKQADDSWRVHFHADYVPSTDWTAPNESEVIARILTEMQKWKARVPREHQKRIVS